MVEFSDPATQASWQAICEAALSNYPHPTDFDADFERVKAAIRRRDADLLRTLAAELPVAEAKANLEPGEDTPFESVDLSYMWAVPDVVDWLREKADSLEHQSEEAPCSSTSPSASPSASC